MKKVVLLVLLSSCGYAPMDNSNQIIITKIDKDYSSFCSYYGRGNRDMTETITILDFRFRDTCGKFQIGDTLNIVKK